MKHYHASITSILLDLASTVIFGSPGGLMTIRDSSNVRGQVPMFISPRNRVVQLHPPCAEFPFRRPPPVGV
jgi:hypothetical protein